MGEFGFKRLTPSPTPTIIEPVPFNLITRYVEVSNGTTIDATYLIRLLQQMIKARIKKTYFQLRIKSIEAWNTSNNALSMEVYSLFGNHRLADVLVNQPARNGWASVGIEWPLSQQHKVITLRPDQTPFAVLYSSDPLYKLLVKITFYWRIQMKPTFTFWRKTESIDSSFEHLCLCDSDDAVEAD